MLTILEVSLALTCAESALYGIFFVLAVTSLVVLVVRHGRDVHEVNAKFSLWSVFNSPLVIATVVLLITISAHWLITVRRLFWAFVGDDGGREPATFFSTVSATSNVAATASVVASVVVGDIILTYRIWAIWERRWIMVVFPSLCTMGYAAAGISVVQLFAVFSQEENVFGVMTQRRIITTAALTLSTNIYGSVSIAYRIWKSNRAMKNDRMMVPGISMAEALVIFVESAALYTCWTFFFLVSYAVQSPLYAFAFQCIPAATGISFMLIIVRVGLGFSWTEAANKTLSLTRPRGPAVGTAAHANESGLEQGAVRLTVRPQEVGRTEPAPVYPLRMIALNVTRTVETETETDFALPRHNEDLKREGDFDLVKELEEV